MSQYTRSRLDGPQPEWLLTFTWAGKAFRLATADLTITDADGDVLPFAAVLPEYPALTIEADLYGATSIPSIPLSVHLPDTSVGTLYSRGFDLEGTEAELAIWHDGDTWEQRIRVLVGEIVGVAWETDDDPIRFTLAARAVGADRRILRRRERVYSGTWSDSARSALGLSYPLVYGAPGPWSEPDGTSRNTSGSPALLVDVTNKTLLIAREAVANDGGSVSVWNITDGSTASITAETATDDLGHLVAVVDLTSSGVTVNTDHEYVARWDGDGGVLGRDGSAVTTLGELIWYLLDRSPGVRWDRGRLAAALGVLDRITVAGHIDDPDETALSWIERNLIPLVPCAQVYGPDGWYLALWLLDARAEDAAAALVEGESVFRLGPIESTARDRVRNTIRLQYAPRERTGEYQGEATITGASVAIGDEVPSGAAQASIDRYGEREELLTTTVIYEGASALTALFWRLRLLGQTLRIARYQISPRLSWLRPGDVVSITDSDVGFSADLASVRAVSWSGGWAQIELILHPS